MDVERNHFEPEPLSGLVRPDYRGGGIVNLISSIVAGCGGEPLAPLLDALSPRELRGRNVVLMVLDGLGHKFLGRHPESFTHRHLRARLTSVLPSTTATAITTFMTGLAPLQHGLTGWFTYLRELGGVATVLPFRPRHGGPSYAAAGIDPRAVFHWPPVADRMASDPHIVSASFIVDSDYSRCTGGRARRHGYRNLEEFFAATARLVRGASRPTYVYAYWPDLDRLCHEQGTTSAAVEQHFGQLDAGLRRFSEAVAGTDTVVVVSADHGVLDTDPEHTIHLEDHPRLARTLTLPLCGEPRLAYCYVRPRYQRQFEDYVRGELPECCTLLPSEQLIEEGLLGDSEPHRELGHRIGDYALLMRDRYVIKDRLLGETPFDQVGVHGGASAAEMYVPLLVLG
ncbi:MAG: alkaline phosphatase family protein [Gammaproteobacteria bacterium]|nr:alkaline phosphatase family protein [Gammaproteobacteria bacterium]NIR98896.1 alkaline phosphatase family protein [Gammaproteobacteria bacterium]NIT64017.1 alkaline phosphatase family protein [Gammaproteobacteria bacterium]NIV19177.1 phosphodiesterase [Gammaproteobacteria bacterium]NIX10346.1 phosphodiesterase [Gammaproteobacteria bacterium]